MDRVEVREERAQVESQDTCPEFGPKPLSAPKNLCFFCRDISGAHHHSMEVKPSSGSLTVRLLTTLSPKASHQKEKI